MPSTSDKQRRFMGAKLAQQRKTGHNSTGMSEDQLSDFASKVNKHGSLTDLDDMAARGGEPTKLKLSGFLYEEGDECHEATERNFEDLASWHSREIKDLPDYNVDIVWMGPETPFRAEEIDMTQYGSDYEPYPLRDYYKSSDKAQERAYRLRIQDQYDEQSQPGESEGKNNEANHRTLDDQMDYLRAVTEKEAHTVTVGGIDTKKSKKFK